MNRIRFSVFDLNKFVGIVKLYRYNYKKKRIGVFKICVYE